MATISTARAIYGLNSLGTPQGTNIGGSNVIGKNQTSLSFSDANIMYSFKVLANADNDVATLTLSTGAVAQTTGTPVITDGDGKDMEGITLATLATGYAILIETVGTTTGIITVDTSTDANGFTKFFKAGETMPLLTGLPSSGTISFTFAEAADAVIVTILGKSA